MEHKNQVPNPTPRAKAKKRAEFMASVFLAVVIISVIALAIVVWRMR